VPFPGYLYLRNYARGQAIQQVRAIRFCLCGGIAFYHNGRHGKNNSWFFIEEQRWQEIK
jgi:hypothetical protein